MIGQVFLTNDAMLNEKEVTLKDNLISNICWKGQLCQ